jgi:GNAT superfamily N-acetyltransferase
MAFEITQEVNPAPEQIQILSDGLVKYNQSKVGATVHRPLAFFLRDDKGSIIGGVHGNYSEGGWLYISALWVSDQARSNGYGSRLMESAEREAITHGCTNAYLDTFSFQAPEFYKKLGYVVFGELEDFPPGHKRIFLRKKLF